MSFETRTDPELALHPKHSLDGDKDTKEHGAFVSVIPMTPSLQKDQATPIEEHRASQDPLNWPTWKKTTILLLVCADYFMFTFLTTVTVPSFFDLQQKYNATYSQINYSVALPALSLAVSPLFWTPLATTIGRRPIMIAGALIALVASIGAACSKSYGPYMAARFFQGWGAGPASTVGLQILEDMYSPLQRGEKIGYWTASIDLGLLFGGFLGGFAASVSTDFPAWLTAILYGALFVLMLLFLSETSYARTPSDLHTVPSLESIAIPHIASGTKSPRSLIRRLFATPIWETTDHVIRLFLYPNISIPIILFSWTWYWWVMCIITMIPAAYPTFSPQKQGLLLLGMIIGTVIAEVFCSGALSDRLVHRLSGGKIEKRTPEMRLWLFIPAAFTTVLGLILFGATEQYQWHWAYGQLATLIFGFGLQVGNTTVSIYAVDCYPEHAMDIVAFYSFHLNLSAFASPFFIIPMTDALGWVWAFSTQAIIVAIFAAGFVPFLFIFGRRLQQWRGPVPWAPS